MIHVVMYSTDTIYSHFYSLLYMSRDSGVTLWVRMGTVLTLYVMVSLERGLMLPLTMAAIGKSGLLKGNWCEQKGVV